MTDRQPQSRGASAFDRIDEICDRFEQEWLAGRFPQIEEYLGQLEEADRPQLLQRTRLTALIDEKKGGTGFCEAFRPFFMGAADCQVVTDHDYRV